MRRMIVARFDECQRADADDDDARQDESDIARSPPESADDFRLAHPVGEGSAERSRKDVGDPKHQHRVQARPRAQRRQQYQAGEEQPGAEVTELRDRRREVTDGGAEREGDGDRRPVEQFATCRRDAVD